MRKARYSGSDPYTLAVNEQIDRALLDDACDASRPLDVRLGAFERLRDRGAFRDGWRRIETELLEAIDAAGGECRTRALVYRLGENGRLVSSLP